MRNLFGFHHHGRFCPHITPDKIHVLCGLFVLCFWLCRGCAVQWLWSTPSINIILQSLHRRCTLPTYFKPRTWLYCVNSAGAKSVVLVMNPLTPLSRLHDGIVYNDRWSTSLFSRFFGWIIDDEHNRGSKIRPKPRIVGIILNYSTLSRQSQILNTNFLPVNWFVLIVFR